jgi:carbonic anhydrase
MHNRFARHTLRPTHTTQPGPAGPPSAVMIACSAECFAPAALTAALRPDAWLVHRTPAALMPPWGAGFPTEEEVLADAAARGAGTVVVCGHTSCSVLAGVLESDGCDDFVLRDWLTLAETTRRASAEQPPASRLRTAVGHCVLAQLAHLRTHPVVASGAVRLFGWVHDDATGQMLCPAADGGPFVRRVALLPEQNRWLRPDYVRRHLSEPRPNGRTPYLA